MHVYIVTAQARLQIDLAGEKYKNAWQCLSHTLAEPAPHGGFRALYRGLGHTLIRTAPVAASVLPVYEFTKDYLNKYAL